MIIVKSKGFTLIEVLLALVIVAIALTALLKATGQNISNTERIKQKTISHWIGMQGISMIQSGLLPMQFNQELTEVTSLLGQRWYWRAKLTPTPIAHMQQINITVSQHQSGPFTDLLIAYRYTP